MSFLTQDKTNWKFLLIVIILVAIVGGVISLGGWSGIVKFIQIQTAKSPEEKCKLAGDIWRSSKNCCCPKVCLIAYYEEQPPECLCCQDLYEELEDETADWQTYKSPNMNFSVGHPISWDVSEIPEDGGWYASLHPSEISTVVFIVRKNNRATCEEKVVGEIKEIVFRNYPALIQDRISYHNCCGDVKSINVCVDDKNIEIVRTIEFYNQDRDDEYSPILEKMMSTFKFLD